MDRLEVDNRTQIFRPKIFWRIFAPIGALTCIGSLALGRLSGDETFYFWLASVILVLWSAFLWTARLEIVDGRMATMRYLGRSNNPVDLKSLQEKDVRLSWAFPYISAVIIVRDTSGNGLTLTRVYWNGWNVLRDLVGGKN